MLTFFLITLSGSGDRAFGRKSEEIMNTSSTLFCACPKVSAYNAGDPGSVPELGRSPGEGSGNPLHYSCLENHMDGGAWQVTVHGAAKSRTPLSDFSFTFHFHALEKEMATHSSVLAWRIPRTGEPGGLPSMRSHRVGHD